MSYMKINYNTERMKSSWGTSPSLDVALAPNNCWVDRDNVDKSLRRRYQITIAGLEPATFAYRPT